jgi:hypothetical protein
MQKPVSSPSLRPSRRARFDHRRPSRSIVLWHLRGTAEDLRGLVIETARGYALAFEVDREVVWLALQPSLEYLVQLADSVYARLVARGWQVIAA